jgi:TonB family protein
MLRAGLVFALLAFFAAQSGPPPVDSSWPPPGVVDALSKGVVPPEVVRKVDPSVPYDTVREGIAGTVVLKCVVEADGSVGEIRVATSLDPRLDNSEIAALKQWTFKAARSIESGAAIRAAITVNMSFRLGTGAAPGPASAWPAEFAHAADTTAWNARAIDLPPLQLKLSYPSTWQLREFPADSNRVAMTGNSLWTRTVTIARPKPLPNGFSTALMARPALEQMARQVMDLQSSQGHTGTLKTFGQVETSSGVWLWLDLDLSIKDLPNAPPATGIFAKARIWMFNAAIEGQYVPVSCTMLVPADATPEHRQEQLDQTTAEFAGIMRHLSIGHR